MCQNCRKLEKEGSLAEVQRHNKVNVMRKKRKLKNRNKIADKLITRQDKRSTFYTDNGLLDKYNNAILNGCTSCLGLLSTVYHLSTKYSDRIKKFTKKTELSIYTQITKINHQIAALEKCPCHIHRPTEQRLDNSNEYIKCANHIKLLKDSHDQQLPFSTKKINYSATQIMEDIRKNCKECNMLRDSLQLKTVRIIFKKHSDKLDPIRQSIKSIITQIKDTEHELAEERKEANIKKHQLKYINKVVSIKKQLQPRHNLDSMVGVEYTEHEKNQDRIIFHNERKNPNRTLDTSVDFTHTSSRQGTIDFIKNCIEEGPQSKNIYLTPTKIKGVPDFLCFRCPCYLVNPSNIETSNKIILLRETDNTLKSSKKTYAHVAKIGSKISKSSSSSNSSSSSSSSTNIKPPKLDTSNRCHRLLCVKTLLRRLDVLPNNISNKTIKDNQEAKDTRLKYNNDINNLRNMVTNFEIRLRRQIRYDTDIVNNPKLVLCLFCNSGLANVLDEELLDLGEYRRQRYEVRQCDNVDCKTVFCSGEECHEKYLVGIPYDDKSSDLNKLDHRKKSCFEVKAIKDKDPNLKEIAKISRQCPSCKQAVMRTEGCNSMKCRCGQYFCWLCCKPCDSTEDCHNHAAEDHKGAKGNWDWRPLD